MRSTLGTRAVDKGGRSGADSATAGDGATPTRLSGQGGDEGAWRPGRPSTSREQILHVLRRHPGLPQVGLVRGLKLSQATVSVAVGELLGAGLVVSTGPARSTGGRRPEQLALNPERPLTLGVDLGAGAAQLGLLNLTGELVEVERVAFRRVRGRVDVDPLIEAAAALAARRAGVAAVGIAVPGMVDAPAGTVRRAANLGWRDVALQALFESGLRLPVAVDHNTNASLLAEEWWGSLAGDPIVFITLGSGVGAAIRPDGRFLHGASGVAGEFGHVTVEPRGIRCRCGRHGCLETRASARALVELHRRLARDAGDGRKGARGRHSVADIAAAALEGDPIATRAVDEVAAWLGAGLNSLIVLLNPQVVVLGGELMAAEHVLLPRVREIVRRDGPRSAKKAVTIVPSRFRELAPIVGAGTLAFERLFRTA